MTICKYIRHGREFALDTDDLDDLDYLHQYGYSQSMQDSVAGVSKTVWEELAEKALKTMGVTPADKTKPFAEFTAFLKDPKNAEFAKDFEALHKQETVKTEIGLLEKRDLAIRENRVASRAGSGEEAIAVEMRRIAMPFLPAWCKSKGFAMPKDKDVRRETLLAYVKAHEAILRPTAEANLKNKEALAKLMAG